MIEVGQSGNTCKKRPVVPEYTGTTLNLGRCNRLNTAWMSACTSSSFLTTGLPAPSVGSLNSTLEILST